MMPVCTLFAVFCFLSGRPAAVRSGYIRFFLGLCLDLSAVAVVLFFCLAEHYSAA